ncbi:lipopolysaccharide transport periplasmic protein LptA [Reinekea forsetii]|nr:lipopolysaccharide transport periplasmic protein LptA [Reinekea forsetii]
MNHKIRNIWRVCSLSCLAATALALPADRELPITGQSDEKTFETATGLVTLTGNVFIRQGHLEIYAQQTSLETNQETKQLQQLIATGSPARFIDLPNEDGNSVEVSGNSIEFYPAKNLIITIGNAQISQNGNTVNGERIEYNTVTGLMNIQSQRALTGNPEDEQAELVIIPGAID